MVDGGPGRKLEGFLDLWCGRPVREGDDFRRRCAPAAREVVKKAREINGAADGTGNHLRSYASFADQQSLADKLVHGLAHGGPGKPQRCGEGEFALQPLTPGQAPVVDGGFYARCHLPVERDGRIAVDTQVQGRHGVAPWSSVPVVGRGGAGGRVAAGTSVFSSVC